MSLARAGHWVIVVDCDLRRPRLHEFFDLENTVGLASVLVEDASLADVVQHVPDEPRLAVVASGRAPPDPSELLSSPRCSEILKMLAAEADYVLLDSPPVLPVTDAIVLAGLVDAVIMVVAANATTRDSADRAIELLEQTDAPLIGTSLTKAGDDPATGPASKYVATGRISACSHPPSCGPTTTGCIGTLELIRTGKRRYTCISAGFTYGLRKGGRF